MMRNFSFLLFLIFVKACSSSNEIQTRDMRANDHALATSYVEFCTLVENAGNFNGKVVSTDAVLITGREYSYLYHPDCIEDSKFVSDTAANRTVSDLLDKYLDPEGDEYLSVGVMRIQAKFSGSFKTKISGGFGHEEFFRHELEISQLENIARVPSSIPYPWK